MKQPSLSFHRILCLLGPLTFLLPLVACGSQAGDALERARTQGIIAGFSVEPPYALVDSTGRPTGHAPELLRAAAKDIGVEDIQWFPLEFQDLIPALLDGRIDVIASGMFIRPERAQRVRFSVPTACVGPVLLARTAAGVQTDEPGDCPDCRIVVVEGSVEQEAFAAERGAGMLLVVPDLATGIAALKSGAGDALAISAPTGRTVARNDPALSTRILAPPEALAEEAAGCAGLAFRPGDESLAAAFDDALKRLVGSAAHRRLAEPFGFRADELP